MSLQQQANSKKETIVEAGNQIAPSKVVCEIWKYRSLIWAFAERDLKVKYFQTILGPLWVLFTPLITVGVMTFVFGVMIKVPSDGLPYLIFYLVAIVPWYALIAVLNHTATSLEAQAGLISKIYFPRLILGGSYALNAAVDFLVGYAVALALAVYYSLDWMKFIAVMPLLLFIQMCWGLGLGLLLAPFNARYRDVKHVIPLIIQLYYFASPIVYPVSAAPEWARWMYQLNPFAIVISGYRSALAGTEMNWFGILYAICAALVTLFAGAAVFMIRERNSVDTL